MSPKVSLLIVTWNAWRDVSRCLHSIRATSFDDREVVVVDNGSVDGTAGKIEKEFPEVRLLKNAVNLGLPKAVNQGLAQCQGRFAMLLDADTELAPDAVSILLEFMEKHPQVSLAAPRIMTPEGEIEESARNFPTMASGLFGRQSLLTRLFPNNPYSRRYLRRGNLHSTEPFEVEQVSAASMFMRRADLADIPWDEGYRCYWVDTDWCVQLNRRGKVIYCVPQARVTHYENNRKGRKKSLWRIWQFHLGAFRVYRRHFTYGGVDPRAWFAAVALGGRAAVQMSLNFFKPNGPPASTNQEEPRVGLG